MINNNKLIPKIVSARDIQTSYKTIFEEAKTLHEPILVMRNNEPQAAIISIDYLEELRNKAMSYEEMEALDTLKSYKEDVKNNRLKKYNSIEELLDAE